MSQQFYDHFAESNRSLAERLGSSRVTLNRDSAVLGTQARPFVQMLNYGLDAITARAASHLLNFDLLHSNTAYLMKLCEGVLLNSIASVAPPRHVPGKPLTFQSQQAYAKYDAVGTCRLLDGTPCSLILYKDPALLGDAPAGLYRYGAYCCAGTYVHQSVPVASLDFTPGTFQSIYINEQYKSIWTDSVEVTLIRNGKGPLKLEPYWSFDALLASGRKDAVLCQHTARGLTVTLGDGEVYGAGYNDGASGLSAVLEVSVSYIKCESLSDADHASLSFNGDVETLGDIPLLSKSSPGDTVESLRARATAEFFAAGKITCAEDMETELAKIPYVKSAHCRLEYDYPLGKFTGTQQSLMQSIDAWLPDVAYTAGAWVRARAPSGYPTAAYVYFCIGDPAPGTVPATSGLWLPMFPVDARYSEALGKFFNRYPTYQTYDNATLVITGLVLKSRHYYRDGRAYAAGDVVYYAKDGTLYKALVDSYGIAPDDPVPEGTQAYWAPAGDLPQDPAFDAYEEITPAMFELELKHYFGIYQKLGFLSAVVEPLDPIRCSVQCSYSSPYPLGQELQEAIASAICWDVGNAVSPEILNAQLAEKFSLSAVSVSVTYMDMEGRALSDVAYNQYVRRSALSVTLEEI